MFLLFLKGWTSAEFLQIRQLSMSPFRKKKKKTRIFNNFEMLKFI